MANSKAVKAWRQNTKNWLVKGFGGSCNKCSYNYCVDALDMHHIDPCIKKFTFSKIMANPMSWSKIVAEASKCILLCCRCHRELHAGCWKLEEIDLIKFVDYKTPELLKLEEVRNGSTGKCPICSAPTYGTICCSRKCAALKSLKTKWPSNDDLIEMISKFNRCGTAERLGVSETAVRKRIKKLGLSVNG